MERIRTLIFLKDIFILAITAFGGPQAHLALFFDRLVKKRRYVTENELLELNALCQILPGPSSTQTITAIAWKRGGFKLAALALMIWLLPAVAIMTGIALSIDFLKTNQISLDFARFIPPVAVGFVAHAAVQITGKTVQTKTSASLWALAVVATFFFRTPWVLPGLLIFSGVAASFKFKKQEKEQKEKLRIKWRYALWYIGIFIGAAVLGGITHSLPIRLFENFYRNGSLIFGGGQVLAPVLYTEFVQFKKYLSSQEFLAGYAMVQAVPGPVFSFSAYIGTLSMRRVDDGLLAGVTGSLMASVGINLPGMLMIFFILNFWQQLKKYRGVRASLEGITAASAGMVVSAALILFNQLGIDFLHLTIEHLLFLGVLLATFLVLRFTRFPPPMLIVIALILGVVI